MAALLCPFTEPRQGQAGRLRVMHVTYVSTRPLTIRVLGHFPLRTTTVSIIGIKTKPFRGEISQLFFPFDTGSWLEEEVGPTLIFYY